MPPQVVPSRHPDAPNHPWHYFQPGYDKPLVAHSEGEMLKVIEDFRIANDLPMGDPAVDLENYRRHLNTRLPRQPRGIVRGKTPAPPAGRAALVRTKPQIKRADQRTFIDKIRTWVKLQKNRKWTPVEPEVANARAAICVSCPKNEALKKTTLCSPCISAVKRDIVILTNNKKVDARLGACRAVNQANSIAVLAPKEELGRSLQLVDETIPECWLRSL